MDYYLDEFTFRFNRRKSMNRGKLFYRLVQQAVAIEPARLDKILHPEKKQAIQPRINKGTYRSTKRREVGPDQFGVGLHVSKDSGESAKQCVHSGEEAIMRTVLAVVLP